MPPTSWYFNPYALLLFCIGLSAIGLMVFCLRRKHIQAVQTLAIEFLWVTVWTLGAALQLSTTNLQIALISANIQQVGYVLIGPTWFLFAVQYTGRGHWLNRERTAALFVLPLIMLAFFWTNALHQGMFTDQRLVATSAGFDLAATFQPLFWVHAAIAYVFIIGGSVLLLHHAFTSAQVYRLQSMLLIFATLIPLAANFISVFGLVALPLDLTPVAFSLSLFAIALSVFQFRLFDLIPLTYERLLAALKEGVIILNERNQIVQVNPAAQEILGGAPLRTLIGADILSLIKPWEAQLRPYLAQEDIEDEVKLDLPDGRSRWFVLQVTPLRRTSGVDARLYGRVAVMTEITARKLNELALAHARDEALQANQFKTQVLSNISHDFRTPLAAILGYAELIQAGFFDDNPTKHAEGMRSIIDNSAYLNQLVNQLLDKSELSTGRLVLQLAPFAPDELAHTSIDALKILAENKRLVLTVEVSDELPKMLVGDAARLRQIISNLTANAIKFTEKGSVQVVLFRSSDSQWAIEVRDSGPGIPNELQSAIFEPFRQLQQMGASAKAGRGRGFGLGLSIVRDLVSLMHGRILVHSEPGVGSTFTIFLPLVLVKEEAHVLPS